VLPRDVVDVPGAPLGQVALRVHTLADVVVGVQFSQTTSKAAYTKFFLPPDARGLPPEQS